MLAKDSSPSKGVKADKSQAKAGCRVAGKSPKKPKVKRKAK